MIPANRSLDATIRIKRADGVWVDITEFVKSVRPHRGDISSVGTGSSGVDAGVLQCEVVIVNDTENHFSPLDKNSSWNQLPDGSYAPLVWPNREIDVKVQTESPVVKFISDDISQGTLNDVEVDAEGHLVLSVAGVDLSYTEDTQADFQAGTLADVAATPGGSLVLAKEGEDFTYTETTQADFEQGMLDGVAATAAGDLELGLVEDTASINGSFENIDASDIPIGWSISKSTQDDGILYGPSNEWFTEGSQSYRLYCGYSDYYTSAYEMFLTNTIDLTNIKEIKFDVLTSSTHGGSYAYGEFIIDGVRYWYSDTPNDEQIDFTIDVSSLSGSCVCRFHARVNPAVATRLAVFNIDNFRLVYYKSSGNRTTEQDLSSVGISSNSSISWDYNGGTNYFGIAGTWHADMTVLGAQNGFNEVASITLTDGYDDIFTSEFTTSDFPDFTGPGKYLYMEFWAKWDKLPDWDNDGEHTWVECPTPDPSKYQRYILKTDGQNSRNEYFRLYFSTVQDTGTQYIADPKVYKAFVNIESNLALDGINYAGWQPCTNGGAIPGVTLGADLSVAKLQLRETLTTTDPAVTPQLHDLALSITSAYKTSGSRIAPPIPLDAVGVARGSTISWQATDGVVIETSLDGGQVWDAPVNGGAIPEVDNQDLAGKSLLVRQTLTTSDITQTPSLDSLSLTLQTGYNLIGSRVSPVYDISSLGTAMTSAVSWQSDEPVGTVVAVDASVNGGAWKSVTNGDTIADIAEGMDLTGATLQFKITEITTDAEVRPSLEKLSCTVQGYKDGLWTIFQGYLGDSINMDGHQVSALCRDPSKRLEDCYIESAQAYGTEAGTPAETVLQEMLDNNLGTGVVTLYCPVSPGFMVTDYTVEYTSLWQAMKTLVQQFGWFLGYFTDSNGNFILCLIEPPRDKNQYTADLTLDYMDDFYDPSTLNISDADIRNVIIVTYRDKATNERKRVVLEDPDSIAQFGRKVMLIEEADTSEINTDEEARDMGAAALYDLKNITGTHKLPMPFVPTVDIFTGINRWDPRISSTVDFFGVESVEHTLDFQNHRFRTQVVGAGKVIGGRASWLEMQVRPGANAAIHAGQVLQGILDAGSAAIVAKGNGGYVVIDKNGQKFISADGAITIEFNTETGEGFFSGRVVGAVYGE